jgi:hypothetical protein
VRLNVVHMSDPRQEHLAAEAARYLALVDLFRAAGCEPHWRRETPERALALSVKAQSRGAKERSTE